jgi:RHS repeat-associated protein
MDGFGRTISTLTGYGTTTLSEVDTVYVFCGCSPIGKMGSQSAPYTPPGTGYLTIYSYDGRGRTVYSELPDGSITHYSYAGNTVTVTDPAGKTKTFTIDALGNLTQVQEPDPALGTVSTNYTYDILNHLIQVSMPRGPNNTQTRTFNYPTGTTVGINLLSATNPENGTVTYTYNSDSTLHTKTDAKSQVFTYSYDSYKRLTQVMVGSTVLRTFMYDTNTLDSNFSGSYTAGRLVAVQNAAFTPNGYGGGNISTPSTMQLVEMYGYTQAGLTSGKRLQVQETLYTTVNGVGQYTPRTLNMDAAYTYDPGGEGKVLSVNYPATNSWNGTQLVKTNGPTYTYAFDSMYRPTGLKDQNNNTVVNNVSYNAANQLSTFNTETRTYNNLNQMTQLTITGSQPLNISYNFTAGQNNGKITSQTDNLSVETVTYQYDSLNRLLSASSSQSWSETYGFDAFGNLLSKTPTGGAPALSQSVYPASNQIMEQTYDSNGNQISSPLGSLTYDAENRIATGPVGVQYAYDSRNKRIWRGTLSGGTLSQQVYFYGVDGQKLGTYTFTLGQYGQTNVPEMTNSVVLLATFFRSKRIGTFDRLGTAKYNQNNAAQSFYPYGEDGGTMQPNDSLKFATYTRDAATGLDYADQRYYASNFGRFMSPDGMSGKRGVPASLNKYAYVRGDPVNFSDPAGKGPIPLMLDDPDNGGLGDDPGDEEYVGGGAGGCGAGWETDASLSGPCCPTSAEGYQGNPFDNPFDPTPQAPNPACYAPPPPAPTKPPPPPPPTCTLEVESRPLNYPGLKNGPDLHGYLVFTSSAVPGVDTIIEGLHIGSMLKAGIGLPGAPPGQAGNADSPGSDTDDGSITNTAVCGALGVLTLDVSQVNGANIKYGGAFGPNSSSVLHYFLQQLSFLMLYGNWYTIPQSMQFFGYNTPLPGLN